MSLLRKPLPLSPDTKIAVIAPSNWVESETLEAALVNARDTHGLNIALHPQCYLRSGNSAGTTAEKLAAFHEVWTDPSVGAVMITRGGSRSLHLLDDLDWPLIAKHPKILLGLSDTTILLNTVYRKAAIPTFHGLHFSQFDAAHANLADTNLRFLRGENWQDPLFPVDHPYEILRGGTANGVLIGGNLAMLYALAASGVDYAPRWSRKILLLEDVGEDLRSLDRMLGALRLAGVFREISGLICGQFTDITDTSTHPFGRTLADMIAEHVLPDLDGPVVMNAPFGHVAQNLPFPIGVYADLVAGETVSLTLCESPFSA